MNDDLCSMIENNDIDGIKKFMALYDLRLDGNKLVPKDAKSKDQLKKRSEFWGFRQLAKKILLNSLYGALLNEALRFADPRLGQSVTLSGRSIVKHMNSKINEIITTIYDHTGAGICYADTDSCYFSALTLIKNHEWREALFAALRDKEEQNTDIAPGDRIYHKFDFKNRSHIIRLYDDIAELANESFPEFMHRTFNTSLKRGAIIKAGRELVGSKALFIKKKKYAILMYDKDGKRLDVDGKPGKLKAMGLDLKRADTPKFMQKFLESILMDLLQEGGKDKIFQDIRDFREKFKSRPANEKGSPKKVANLAHYSEKAIKALHKVNMPGHVRASLHWNRLCEANNDKYSMRITDGTRIVVCKLKPNAMNIDSIAYPIDEPHLPKWFFELPFDHEEMENVIIDKKLDNLLSVLNWDLADTKLRPGDEFFA